MLSGDLCEEDWVYWVRGDLCEEDWVCWVRVAMCWISGDCVLSKGWSCVGQGNGRVLGKGWLCVG